MYNKLKILLKKSVNYYYKIVKLPTGYTGLNFFLSLLVILLGLFSIFLGKDIFNYLSNYPNLIKLIIYSGFYYSLFLGINLFCRVTTTVFKGIPFFIRLIKINKSTLKYFIGYLVFNIFLTVLSIFILIRISTFYLNYYGDSFYGFMLYELTIILLLFINHIYFSFNEYNYDLDLNKVYNFTFLQLFMLLLTPFVLFLNSVLINLPSLNIFGTVYCQPDNDTQNTDEQVNSNNQEALLDNQNAENKNLQANKNIQESVANTSTSKTSLNSQINKNQQINTGSPTNLNRQNNNNIQVNKYNTNLLAPLIEVDKLSDSSSEFGLSPFDWWTIIRLCKMFFNSCS
nr:hypothetical protein [Ganoderma leucocontextum]